MTLLRCSSLAAQLTLHSATPWKQSLSPMRHIEGLEVPLILARAESPEFVRQTHDFFAALRAAGKRRRRGLESLQAVRDAGQFLRRHRPSEAAADGAQAGR